MSDTAMMSFAELAQAVDGRLIATAADAVFGGVTTDSRAVSAGDLFVALAGDKFDGHDFIDAVSKAGAAGALVHRAPAQRPAIPLVRVADTRLALGKLAGFWRNRYQGRLAALTGSNGKTTVKEMTAAILRNACADRCQVLATEGNLNNDIGMPLTLLKLRPQHRYAVIEMGMNHLGEIDYLTRIARPHAALINNAHRAHVGEVGGLRAIAQAKGEIFAGLSSDGVALFNADDTFAAEWAGLASRYRRISFGIGQGDVRAEIGELTSSGTAVTFVTPAGRVKARLQVPGEHNVRNAAAACAIAFAFDVPADAITRGLSDYAGTKGRLQRKAGLNGAVVLDDSYNANPDSMAAAIAVLASVKGAKILIMGDMGELGDEAAALHADAGALAKRAGIERLFGLGDFTSRAVEAFGQNGAHFATVAHLSAALRPLMHRDTTVLIKGSRFMRMERVVEAITLPVEH